MHYRQLAKKAYKDRGLKIYIKIGGILLYCGQNILNPVSNENKKWSRLSGLVILYPLSNSKQKLEGGSIQGVSPMSMKNMSLIYFF